MIATVVSGNGSRASRDNGDGQPSKTQDRTAERSCSSFSRPTPTMTWFPTKITGNFEGKIPYFTDRAHIRSAAPGSVSLTWAT